MALPDNIKRQITVTVQNCILNNSAESYDIGMSYDQNLAVDI